jgi:hypothetical protein
VQILDSGCGEPLAPSCVGQNIRKRIAEREQVEQVDAKPFEGHKKRPV